MSENYIDMDLATWKRLEQIGVCASRDESRIILTAVYVEPTEGEITVTATDSYRLATTTLEADTKSFDPFLLPAKPIKDVRIAIGKVKELSKNPSLHLTVTDDVLHVTATDEDETPRFSQVITLIDGNFPRYEAIFPEEDEGLEGLTKADLVTFIEKYGDLNGHSERDNKAELLQVAQQYKIGPAYAAFNAEYLADMAVAADAKDHLPLQFRVRGPLKPITLTSPADRNFRGLVMPVRI